MISIEVSEGHLIVPDGGFLNPLVINQWMSTIVQLLKIAFQLVYCSFSEITLSGDYHEGIEP